MLETYDIVDNHFSPSLDSEKIEEIYNNIVAFNSYFGDNPSTAQKVIELLGNSDEKNKTEMIITYEILYNIYKGNTNIAEIVSYIDRNSLSVSFESLLKFFNDNEKDESLKVYIVLAKLLNVSVIEVKSNATISPSPSVMMKKKATNGSLNLPSGISYGTTSIGISKTTMLKFLVDNGYFSNIIFDNGLSRNLSDIILYPKYDFTNGFKSERSAFDTYVSYFQKLPKNVSTDITAAYSKLKTSKIKEFFKQLFLENRSNSFSNDRKIKSGSIVSFPVHGNQLCFQNPEDNKLMEWILNSDVFIGNENIKLNLGKEQINRFSAWFAKHISNKIDIFNVSCHSFPMEVTSKLRNILGEGFESIRTDDNETIINSIYKNSDKKITSEEAEEIRDSISGMLDAAEEIKNREIMYTNLPNDFKAYEAFCELIDTYINNNEDFEITKLDYVYLYEYLYFLNEFFNLFGINGKEDESINENTEKNRENILSRISPFFDDVKILRDIFNEVAVEITKLDDKFYFKY